MKFRARERPAAVSPSTPDATAIWPLRESESRGLSLFIEHALDLTNGPPRGLRG